MPTIFIDIACMRQFPNLVRIISEVVDAVVYWPFAAWPQASCGLYDSDEEHMFFMNRMLKTEEDTEDFIAQFVIPITSRGLIPGPYWRGKNDCAQRNPNCLFDGSIPAVDSE